MSRERVRPQTDEANHGSRTLSVTEREESTPDESAASTSTAGVLRLRGRALNHVKVQWEEDVVDNEFLNRKKSKICCIYHKPKAFDESSGEESDSSCGSNDSRNGAPRPHSHPHPHGNAHGHDHVGADGASGSSGGGGRGGTAQRDGGGSSTVVERPPTPPEPNAYEKEPKNDKGKARAP